MRLSDHPRRPTWHWVIGREQCTEVTSHHTFLNNVHVARSTTKTSWRLRFFIYVKPFKTPTLLHYFITYHFSSISYSSKTLSLPLWTPLPSKLTYYSTSAVERATHACFLHCHEIKLHPSKWQVPLVLFLSILQPAKSESEYPVKLNEMLRGYHKPTSLNFT